MRQRTYDTIGWGIFGLGCVPFIINAVMHGSMLTLIGSILFLVGVLIVLTPYFWKVEVEEQ